MKQRTEWFTLTSTVIWNIWLKRNRRMFKRDAMAPIKLAEDIKDSLNMSAAMETLSRGSTNVVIR